MNTYAGRGIGYRPPQDPNTRGIRTNPTIEGPTHRDPAGTNPPADQGQRCGYRTPLILDPTTRQWLHLATRSPCPNRADATRP
jgi:hypothetical protein